MAECSDRSECSWVLILVRGDWRSIRRQLWSRGATVRDPRNEYNCDVGRRRLIFIGLREREWLLRPCLAEKIDHSSPITQISLLITHHPIIHFLSLKNSQISPKPIWHLNPNMFSTPKTPKSRTHILTWVPLLPVLSKPHPSPPHPIYPKAKTQLYQNQVHHSPTLRVLCHCRPSPVWDRAVAGWIRSDTSLDVVKETTQYLSLLYAKRSIYAHESSNRCCSSVGMSSSSNIFFDTR